MPAAAKPRLIARSFFDIFIMAIVLVNLILWLTRRRPLLCGGRGALGWCRRGRLSRRSGFGRGRFRVEVGGGRVVSGQKELSMQRFCLCLLIELIYLKIG